MPAESLDDLGIIGNWSLRRILVDRRQQMFGKVLGSLTVMPDDDGATWTETGTLTWGSFTAPVTRQLGVRLIDGQWWLMFSDGREFHPWRPGQPVLHPCRADEYCGLVRLTDDASTMRILWDVTGPAKDQRIYTEFNRADL